MSSKLPTRLSQVRFSVSSADNARSSGRMAPDGETPPPPSTQHLVGRFYGTIVLHRQCSSEQPTHFGVDFPPLLFGEEDQLLGVELDPFYYDPALFELGEWRTGHGLVFVESVSDLIDADSTECFIVLVVRPQHGDRTSHGFLLSVVDDSQRTTVARGDQVTSLISEGAFLSVDKGGL